MYIAFEGIDGSGKSTQAQMLVETLQNCFAQTVHLISEPDKDMIRKIAINDHKYMATAMYLQRLRDRGKISTLLRKGDIVVTDRSFVSTFAYQGLHEWNFVCNLHNTMRDHIIIPDIAFVMHIETNYALQRVEKRGGEKVTQEMAKELHLVNEIYKSGDACVGVKSYAIDGHRSPEAINYSVMLNLSKYIEDNLQIE